MIENKTKIVIIGGGFGGVYTARYLERLLGEKAEITLINKSNYFLFTPLLHEVATGGLTPDSVVEPIREVFRGTCVKFVEDTAVTVKQNEKEIITSNSSFAYDYLVISTGAQTNFFGVSGAKEHSFSLKDLNDAISIRNHILQTFEQAMASGKKSLLTCTVVGAGPTGAELAAELLEYMRDTLCTYYKNSGFSKEDVKINLITNTAEIITQFPVPMREIALKELRKKGVNVMLNVCVVKVEPHLIIFADGTKLESHTIVWVAGVKPTLTETKSLDVGIKGRIEVNDYLQSCKNPEIFALGDAGGSFPMLAQVAVQQAKTVANNIYALTKKRELSKFSFYQKGLLISFGQWYAIGYFFGMTFRGRLMWVLWRLVYLFNFLSLRKKAEISMEWTINAFYPRDITYIK